MIATSLPLPTIGGIPPVKRTVRFTSELSAITPCKLLSVPSRGCSFELWRITRHRLEPLRNWIEGEDEDFDAIRDIEGLLEYRDTAEGPIPTGRFEVLRTIKHCSAEGVACEDIDFMQSGNIEELTVAEMVQARNELPAILANAEAKVFTLQPIAS